MVVHMTTRTSHGEPDPVLPPAHEHGWTVESRHSTSVGWVLYVRCSECEARRVDLRPHGSVETPPTASSREIPIGSAASDGSEERDHRCVHTRSG